MKKKLCNLDNFSIFSTFKLSMMMSVGKLMSIIGYHVYDAIDIELGIKKGIDSSKCLISYSPYKLLFVES